MMNETSPFTEEEIKAAQAAKKVIIEGDNDALKAVYMSGEICMWIDMQADHRAQIEAAFVAGDDNSLHEEDDEYFKTAAHYYNATFTTTPPSSVNGDEHPMTPPTNTHKAIKNERTIGTGESGPILLRPIPSIPISDLENMMGDQWDTLFGHQVIHVTDLQFFIDKYKNK